MDIDEVSLKSGKIFTDKRSIRLSGLMLFCRNFLAIPADFTKSPFMLRLFVDFNKIREEQFYRRYKFALSSGSSERKMERLQQAAARLPQWLPGVILAIAIAAAAKFLGGIFPLVGGILFAILIGAALRNTAGINPVFEQGLTLTVKRLLKAAVVLLGAGLNIFDIFEIGRQSLLIIFVSVCSGILLTLWFGHFLKLGKTLSLLIGVGASICGATAISAVKGLLGAKDDETAYAISTIVFFNLIAFFLYPIIGHVFHMNDQAFGIWAGTAVHDTSSAIAVGYVYGNEAGEVATTVKLGRTIFLLPLILILPILMGTADKSSRAGSFKKAFPWFIVWFLAVSMLNSFGAFPAAVQDLLSSISKFVIIMVMAAVGLQTDLKQFAKLGVMPLLTGLFASAAVSLISFGLVYWLIL